MTPPPLPLFLEVLILEELKRDFSERNYMLDKPTGELNMGTQEGACELRVDLSLLQKQTNALALELKARFLENPPADLIVKIGDKLGDIVFSEPVSTFGADGSNVILWTPSYGPWFEGFVSALRTGNADDVAHILASFSTV